MPVNKLIILLKITERKMEKDLQEIGSKLEIKVYFSNVVAFNVTKKMIFDLIDTIRKIDYEYECKVVHDSGKMMHLVIKW